MGNVSCTPKLPCFDGKTVKPYYRVLYWMRYNFCFQGKVFSSSKPRTFDLSFFHKLVCCVQSGLSEPSFCFQLHFKKTKKTSCKSLLLQTKMNNQNQVTYNLSGDTSYLLITRKVFPGSQDMIAFHFT